MKAVLLMFVLGVTARMHLTVAVLGLRVSVPVPALVVAAEVLAAAGLVLVAVRALRGFRPPWFVVARSAP